MKVYSKKDYPLEQIRRHLETGPIVLVSSFWKGKTNIMTMGWHMMMQFTPALFGCYIWDGDHSFEMIRNSRECVINIPTIELVDAVVGIGNSTGRRLELPKSSESGESNRLAKLDRKMGTDCHRRGARHAGKPGPRIPWLTD